MPKKPVAEMSDLEKAQELRQIKVALELNIVGLKRCVEAAAMYYDEYEALYARAVFKEAHNAMYAVRRKADELERAHNERIEYAKKYLKIGE